MKQLTKNDHIDAASCQRLWCAMLIRNLTDATGEGKILSETESVSKRYIREAQDWIGTKNFRRICELTGFDPDAIEEKYHSGELKVLLDKMRDPLRNKKPRPEGQGKQQGKENPFQRHHNVTPGYEQHHIGARA